MFGVGFDLTRRRWWVKRGKRDGAVGWVKVVVVVQGRSGATATFPSAIRTG